MNSTNKHFIPLLLFAVVGKFSLNAQTFTYNGLNYGLSGGAAYVAENSNIKGTVDIPSEVEYQGNTYLVTRIGNNAFDTNGSTNNDVEKVILHEGLKSIGERAFHDNRHITEISFPSTLEVIEKEAFYFCLGLEKASFNEGLKEIKDNAFSVCALTELVLPSTLEFIGSAAFSGNVPIVTIPKNVMEIGSGAFHTKTKKVIIEDTDQMLIAGNAIFDETLEDLYLGRNINEWGTYISINIAAFNNLTNIRFGENVTYLNDSFFMNCSTLKEITLPKYLEKIGSAAFYGCSGLTEIRIPNTVNTIGDSAFRNCKSLKRFIIEDGDEALNSLGIFAFGIEGELYGVIYDDLSPVEYVYVGRSFSGGFEKTVKTAELGEKVKFIGETTFENTSITEIDIPENVESIGYYAFRNCQELSKITVHWQRPISIQNTVFRNVNHDVCQLIVPFGCLTNYKEANNWKDFVNILEGSTSSDIHNPKTDREPMSIFTIDGQQVRQYGHGLNIVKYQNGHTRKILNK